MTEKAKIQITLSNDEALVLFEFLSRFNEQERQGVFEDEAEQFILADIECLLEKELVEPFDKNYREIIEASRKRVREGK